MEKVKILGKTYEIGPGKRKGKDGKFRPIPILGKFDPETGKVTMFDPKILDFMPGWTFRLDGKGKLKMVKLDPSQTFKEETFEEEP